MRWLREGGWYLVLDVVTLGIGSPIPFAHAAVRLKRPLAFVWPVLYAAAVVALLVAVEPSETRTDNTVGGLIIGLMVVAFCHLLWVRRQVWPATRAPVDPAMAEALAAREKRAQARRIVAEDPALARELKIGRPDLDPPFDDGGLVDLGGAPAGTIAQVCAIDPDLADQIVRTREARPFDTLEDVFTWADIPYAQWERIRDRAVVVR
ncbi:hypothetical protein [Pseudonocardia oroxyli]|uniref:Helix-hairpin-helix motif-containing protein n=1 Tax=Pseudonocardia oroxyli TaxID=366584 RepID=A0A1G7XLK9_PSEOR|nr:hypothetical protein [Pseudonocardia oroxyli]SDG85085.1 hypothetical protein SAMN05216377_11620 [Pseudonocardia oroxyli]